MRRLLLLALLLVGCGGGVAATPIVIYVTPPPSLAVPSIAPSSTAAASSTPMPSPTEVMHSLTVQINLYDEAFGGGILSVGDTKCRGNGGYADIGDGMQATIKDSAGKILGVGNIDGDGTSITHESTWTTHCQWSTQVADIPESPFYAVDFGRRGSIQFPLSELQGDGWVAVVSMGK